MNTIWSLKPGLTVLRVFGFWPFRIDEKNQIQPSRAYNIYSWMLLITFAVLLGYSFVFENLENDLESTVSFLLLVLVNFVVFLAILETVWKQSAQREMLENFQHVDNILQFRMSNSIFDHLRGHFTNSVALEMVLLSVIMALSIAIHLILKVPQELKHFAFYFVGYTFSSMRYLQIIYFTWMIRSRLNYLKEALLKLVYKKNITVKTVSISAMDTIRIRDFDFGVKKNRVVPFEKGLATFNGDLSGLAVLRDVYNKLWINSQLFNKAFGLSLLVNIGYDFLALTTDIYWLIVSFSTTVPSVSPTPALYGEQKESKIFGNFFVRGSFQWPPSLQSCTLSTWCSYAVSVTIRLSV